LTAFLEKAVYHQRRHPMRKSLIAATAALGLTAATAGLAQASDKVMIGTDAPRSEWLSVGQAANILTSQGYDVLEIKTDIGLYEIKALNTKGEHVEAYVDPLSGKVLAQKRGANERYD